MSHIRDEKISHISLSLNSELLSWISNEQKNCDLLQRSHVLIGKSIKHIDWYSELISKYKTIISNYEQHFNKTLDKPDRFALMTLFHIDINDDIKSWYDVMEQAYKSIGILFNLPINQGKCCCSQSNLKHIFCIINKYDRALLCGSECILKTTLICKTDTEKASIKKEINKMTKLPKCLKCGIVFDDITTFCDVHAKICVTCKSYHYNDCDYCDTCIPKPCDTCNKNHQRASKYCSNDCTPSPCKSCKHVELLSSGLCQICKDKRPCRKCGLFVSNNNFCTNCLNNMCNMCTICASKFNDKHFMCIKCNTTRKCCGKCLRLNPRDCIICYGDKCSYCDKICIVTKICTICKLTYKCCWVHGAHGYINNKFNHVDACIDKCNSCVNGIDSDTESIVKPIHETSQTIPIKKLKLTLKLPLIHDEIAH